MGKPATVKGFLDETGYTDFLEITPYGSEYPLKTFVLSLSKSGQEFEGDFWEDSNQSKYRQSIKEQFIKFLDTHQQLIAFFKDFNLFDVETAFFILDLAKLFVNMNAGKTVLFLISYDETVSYRLRNRIKNLGKYTNYILFPDWTGGDLEELFEDIYPNSKISQEDLEQIINYSFKNAGVFLNNIEYLKERGYIYLRNQYWICEGFPQDVLFGNYREIIQLRYDSLEPTLKDALENASIVGIQFDAITIQNAFHLKMAAQLMKEIEQISRLIFQIDVREFDFGFVNRQTHQLIESYIPKEKRDN